MIRKDVIFAVLATFCLSTILFTVIPVGSYGTYDPWMDFNDDGKIDVRDVSPVAAAYGSTGNPTKNVTVTNLPLDENGNMKVIVQQNVTAPALKTELEDILLLDNFLFYIEPYCRGVTLSPYSTAAFYFNFEPTSGFLRATHVYTSAVLSMVPGRHGFNFSIDSNPNSSISANLDFAGWTVPHSIALDWTISDVNAGMHRFSVFAEDGFEAYIHRLEIFIEYEYMG